jgi:hypothetical protein
MFSISLECRATIITAAHRLLGCTSREVSVAVLPLQLCTTTRESLVVVVLASTGTSTVLASSVVLAITTVLVSQYRVVVPPLPGYRY